MSHATAIKTRPTRTLVTGVLAVVLVMTARPVSAQTALLEQLITGPPQTQFGEATAIEDATLVVGAPHENSSRGAVYVYGRTGTTWTLQQRLEAFVDGTPGAMFGAAVAISGNSIVVGTPAAVNRGATVGAAYVYERSGGVWTGAQKLTADDATADAGFGTSVDIDGSTVIVGAPAAPANGVPAVGAAYVFTGSGRNWTERRIAAPGSAAFDAFGRSVGVSGDTACVGADGHDTGGSPDRGAAYLFTRAAGWTFHQQLASTDATAADAFGSSCAVDGGIVAVGARGADAGAETDAGAVSIFVRAGPSWLERQRLLGNESNAGLANVSVAGDLLVVGADQERSSEGGIHVYRRSGASWVSTQRIGNAGDAAGRRFGHGASTDGRSIVGGAPLPSSLSGMAGNTATVFTLPAELPGAPTAPSAVVRGNHLRFTWDAPTTGGVARSYALVVRASPGASPLVVLPLGAGAEFSTAAPNGTYILSVAAANAAGAGPESATTSVSFPGPPPSAPGAPTGLAASVLDSTVTFTWAAPLSGDAPAGYALLAGTSPSFTTVAAVIPLPASPSSVTITGVPAGTYYARIVAQNSGGTSDGSNEVTVMVAGPRAPGAPILSAQVTGRTVNVSWTAGSGGTPARYILSAALTAGGAPIAVLPFTANGAVFTNVPGGTYYLRLTAANAVGESAPSNQVTITVP